MARADLIFHGTSRYGADRAELVIVLEPGRHHHTKTTVATIDVSSGERVSKMVGKKTHVSWGKIKWSRQWYIFRMIILLISVITTLLLVSTCSS